MPPANPQPVGSLGADLGGQNLHTEKNKMWRCSQSLHQEHGWETHVNIQTHGVVLGKEPFVLLTRVGMVQDFSWQINRTQWKKL